MPGLLPAVRPISRPVVTQTLHHPRGSGLQGTGSPQESSPSPAYVQLAVWRQVSGLHNKERARDDKPLTSAKVAPPCSRRVCRLRRASLCRAWKSREKSWTAAAERHLPLALRSEGFVRVHSPIPPCLAGSFDQGPRLHCGKRAPAGCQARCEGCLPMRPAPSRCCPGPTPGQIPRIIFHFPRPYVL